MKKFLGLIFVLAVLSLVSLMVVALVVISKKALLLSKRLYLY